eukprot:6201186-Pleurochrysis_carterae.AAC.2
MFARSASVLLHSSLCRSLFRTPFGVFFALGLVVLTSTRFQSRWARVRWSSSLAVRSERRLGAAVSAGARSFRLDLNAADADGRSCVHLAASAGNLVAIKALAELRCELSAQDSAGATPLSESVARGHLGVARLLVESRAQLNAERAPTQLLAHARGGEAEAVALLLAGGADADATDDEGRSERSAAHTPPPPTLRTLSCIARPLESLADERADGKTQTLS